MFYSSFYFFFWSDGSMNKNATMFVVRVVGYESTSRGNAIKVARINVVFVVSVVSFWIKRRFGVWMKRVMGNAWFIVVESWKG